MTIKQQGGIFGRNPSYNEVGANELNVDNIKIDGNNITSTNTNGDIAISPDGTGSLIIGNNGQADYVAAKIRKKFNGYVSVQFDGGGADPYADFRMDFSENLALRLDPNNVLADQTFSITHNGSDFAQFIGSSGNLLLNTGNLVIGTSGKGIDFSATADGSGTTTSELLSDYEEGTWEPTYATISGTAIPTMTMANQFGRYVKVGNLVTVTLLLDTSNVDITGVTSESLTITGLPFTNAASAWAPAHIGSTGTWSTQIYSGVVPQLNPRIDLYTRTSTTAAPASAILSALSTGSNANHNQLNIAASYLVF